MLLASCTETQSVLQVCETGEKVMLVNDIYAVGDTVVLQQTVDQLGNLYFEIDHNWISFSESYKYLGETGYYKAVVIE
jgi:hypothetical protein